jgi:hypothetical protein
MGIKDAFSAVEWAILTDLPERIVASAITADPISGLGAILEEVAGLTQLSHGAMRRPESSLVQEVFAEYKEGGEGEARTLELSQQGIEQLVPETVELAARVAELLAERVPPEESAAYAAWLRETAESVCGAARSGGILGIGGRRVSEEEEAFLAQLDAAFAPVAGENLPES